MNEAHEREGETMRIAIQWKRSSRSSLLHLLTIVSAALVVAALGPSSAYAWTLKTLYSFGWDDGYHGTQPSGGLVADQAGNLYGTTLSGGARGYGTVFVLTRQNDGSFKHEVLYNFCGEPCSDGGYLVDVRLVIDTAGSLYGLTIEGGTEYAGTVFKLTPPPDGKKRWSHTVIYNFCTKDSFCSDGQEPVGALAYVGQLAGAVYDGVSPLYGVAESGGRKNGGTIYALTPNNKGIWSLKILHTFCKEPHCADGRSPNTVVPLASDTVYGASTSGLPHDAGTVFKVERDVSGKWNETVLHGFCSENACADGKNPYGLTSDPTGTLYGTTLKRGLFGGGVVYKVLPDGTESTIYDFCSLENCADGERPSGSMIMDPAGNLFGVTSGGGLGSGTIFELNGSGLQVLHAFCTELGCGKNPTDQLLLDTSGNLFGVTAGGGNYGYGTVFELSP
jgi:uncharacterized repeat protein (TIGR03803 family)